jgi:hypothetical protein
MRRMFVCCVVWLAAVCSGTQSWAQKSLASKGCRTASGGIVWVDPNTPCPSSSGSSAPNPATTMAPALGAGAYNLGYSLGSALRQMLQDDPEEEARQAARMRQAEQARRAEEARQKAAQDRRREEMYRRVTAALGMSPHNQASDANPLGLIGIGGDTKLQPSGSGFFGDPLAGSPFVGYDASDPNVVDLRNLQSGYALATAAKSLPAADAREMTEEALRVAMGEAKPGLSAVGRLEVPKVDEAAFLEFQRASFAYRRERDGRFRLTEIFNEANERRRIAKELADRARRDYEAALRKGLAKAKVKEKHKLMADVFGALKVEEEAERKAQRILDEVRGAEGVAHGDAVRALTLRVLADDAAYQRTWGTYPPIPLRVKDESFIGRFDEAVRKAQARVEIELDHLIGKIERLGLPRPPAYEPAQEAIVGAGELSWASGPPQKLIGKDYERLVVHGDALLPAAALLEKDLVKTRELRVVSGDRALAAAPVFERLVAHGKAKNVVIVNALNDPGVWPTGLPAWSAENAPAGTLERLAKQAAGEPRGNIEYRLLRPACREFTVDCHAFERTSSAALTK